MANRSRTYGVTHSGRSSGEQNDANQFHHEGHLGIADEAEAQEESALFSKTETRHQDEGSYGPDAETYTILDGIIR